jgi:hypothetical protein
MFNNSEELWLYGLASSCTCHERLWNSCLLLLFWIILCHLRANLIYTQMTVFNSQGCIQTNKNTLSIKINNLQYS